jgi:hypothetical protein
MDKNENCFICKNFNEFEMPKDIVDALVKENLVLFCGAGISTENRTVLPDTLYSVIKFELGIDGDLSFSELMSKFCNLPNGRIKLTQIILNRFNYVDSFPELLQRATRFHKTLASIPQINTIVTTNWDDYFEKYCNAVPFVYAEDIPLWDSSIRRVLKLHGSITNISSMVATKEDYVKCYKKLSTGVFSSKLIDILATKTVVFIGFSFEDEDFQQLLSLISKQMGNYMPHIYIISLDERIADKLKGYRVSPIITDGEYFLDMLRRHLIDLKCIFEDTHFIFANDIYDNIRQCHHEISNNNFFKKFPLNIYSLMYQDGLIHAFERFLNNKEGLYYKKCYLRNCIDSYSHILKRSRKRYFDASYLEGYLNGLILLYSGIEGITSFPMFYVPIWKQDICSLEEYKQALEALENSSGKYMTQAKKLIKDDEKVVMHHPPILLSIE